MTIWITKNKSPRPPDAVGRPFPLRRSLLPARLAGGTFTRTGSVKVGASTSAPSAASHGQTGSSTWMSAPSRRNTGSGAMCTRRYRSPRLPPFAPGAPLPATRTRVPCWTPAGILTSIVRVLGRP